MAINKRNVEDIDESLLLSSIKEKDPQKRITEQSVQKNTEHNTESEKPKMVKESFLHEHTVSDYSSMFLQKNEFKTRQCVYISDRIHATISEIVRVIADKNVTVGGYIDIVLLQHLEAHKDEINKLYKKDRKDLIK
jgi:hypothetical protein